MSSTKEITESLGFGVVFAAIKAISRLCQREEGYPIFSWEKHGDRRWCRRCIRLWEEEQMVPMGRVK